MSAGQIEHIETPESRLIFAEFFDFHKKELLLMHDNPKEYLRHCELYKEITSQMPSPPLVWDIYKGDLSRFHQITTGTQFKLFSEISKDEFMAHFLPGKLWKEPIILVGQLNILAAVINRLVDEEIIRNKKSNRFKLSAPHFLSKSLDPLEKDKPIKAHDLSKALCQGLHTEAWKIVDDIIEYVLIKHVNIR